MRLLLFFVSQADFIIRCDTLLESEVNCVAELTGKQQRFVDEYLVDLNATQAAKRAGYKDPNIGRQLITKNNIAAEIRRRKASLSKQTNITQEMVLNELAKVAFAEAGDRSNENLRYANKLKALELLAKHLGLFEQADNGEEGEACGVAQIPAVMTPTKPPEEIDG